MDSSNANNPQQRYCSTPIMAPPSVASSPPVMGGGGNVMGGMHQPAHHPPPSISPHPAAYYSHHSAAASHYPTPSPTPPLPSMHHQQYYNHQHPYYAHGSHQPQPQQQPQSQQQSHHAVGHVGMSTPAATPPPQSQHPQWQHHHQQQWAAPSHTHQQQSHHYYHHAPPPQQPQQHSYPPPSHSPYPYAQAHSAAPTPPTQQQQQQLVPPPVPASPGPSQIHQQQQPPPQQQNQSHALINLSRFVSQQSASPSPRASPSLAHHQQQISQMGPISPAPFGGHLEQHHPTMNGHNPPVMSPPPPMVHSQQQAMSPPPSIPVPQHHLPAPSPIPYNVNGAGAVMDRHLPMPARPGSASSDKGKHDSLDFRGLDMPDSDLSKDRDNMHNILNAFPNLSSAMGTKDSDNLSSAVNSDPVPPSSSAKNEPSSIMNSSSSEISFPSLSSPLRRESNDSCTSANLDIPRPNGGGAETITPQGSNAAVDGDHGRPSSVSPQAKPMGSPTNTGNGHQMMPVRLQNMQKGARTKASMKKLMQEQQISTPNGQISETNSDGVGVSGKEVESDSLEVEVAPPSPTKGNKGKSPKSPKKKKIQNSVAPSADSVDTSDAFIPPAISSDLSSNNDTTAAAAEAIFPRPGYTKSGKKIGRPRKDSLPPPPAKGKGKKAGKAVAPPKKKKKGSVSLDESLPVSDGEVSITANTILEPEANEVIPEVHSVEAHGGKKISGKGKATKTSRKRSSKVLSDISGVHDFTNDLSPLASPDLSQLSASDPDPSQDESVATPVQRGRKRKSKSKTNLNSTDEAVAVDPAPTSEITEQVAESTARNLISPGRVAAKGRGRKGTKLAEPEPESAELDPVAVTPKQRRGSSKKITMSPSKDVDTSPERGDLPRLRSRSPKQSDSPPLRLSSPRAAKERSATPASANVSQRSQRASRSREKDVAAPVSAPLASPALRSPKKTEAAMGTARIVKGKKKANESLELQNEYLSPPPVKRTRQVSQESSESGEVSRGRRKGIREPRASIDSDRSLSSSVGRRASRRKSGSVSGSTDRESLASPSFNQSGSSLIPQSDSSFETAAENLSSVPAPISKRTKQKKQPSLPVKRGRGKAAKPKFTSKKASGKAAKALVATQQEDEPIALAENVTLEDPQTSAVSEVIAKPIPLPRPKWKKQRKYIKKGRPPKNAVPDFLPSLEYPDASATNQLATIPVAEVPEVKDDTELISTPLPSSPPKQKGKKKYVKKSKKGVVPAVLNIPAPLPLSPKKGKGKAKLENKQPKQPKKLSKGSKKVEVHEGKDPYQFDSSDVTGTSSSIVTDEDSKVQQTAFVFSPPQDLSLGRRRRSSAISPVNTQSSAKSSGVESALPLKSEEVFGGNESQNNARTSMKAHRRDSRSVSREFEVSVVLSDIARSPEFSSLASPSQSDFLSSSQPEPLKVDLPSSPSKLVPAEPNSSQNSMNSLLSLSVKSEDNELQPKKKKQTKLGKTKSSTNLEDEKPPKKKSRSLLHKMEFQERKANLEAEVAQALIDLKSGSSGTSSKSPSPSKSILGMDSSAEMLSPQLPKKKSKLSKTGKTRKSTNSPRLSLNSISNKQENIVPSNDAELLTPNEVMLTAPAGKKRKGRRPSLKSKSKSKQLSVLPSPIESYPAPNSSSAAEMVVQSLKFSPHPSQASSVAVAKTVLIPTASSLGMPEPLSSPIIAPVPVRVKKERKSVEKRGKRKASLVSPDITAVMPTASIAATSTPLPKLKRKKSKKEVKTEDQSGSIQSAIMKQEPSGETAGVETPVKKKRQRKPKVPAVVSDAVPSTSAAEAVSNSMGQLFPYQTDPIPYRKPTVFTKFLGKADDNQKSKERDGPSVRVLGGVAKFYRGGEEEEVDTDPRMPKKGQLPTDNAVPWICSFCHLGPHAQKLGDLFGPYFANLPPVYGTAPKRETWMHGDCGLWAGSLILIGTYLRRLEETLQDSDKETCTVCKRTGATIGCLRRGCKEAVHYPCAVRKFWKMDEQNFHSYCPKHSS